MKCPTFTFLWWIHCLICTLNGEQMFISFLPSLEVQRGKQILSVDRFRRPFPFCMTIWARSNSNEWTKWATTACPMDTDLCLVSTRSRRLLSITSNNKYITNYENCHTNFRLANSRRESKIVLSTTAEKYGRMEYGVQVRPRRRSIHSETLSENWYVCTSQLWSIHW